MSRIVLIGAGNVAWHLGIGLCEKGHEIIQVFSRTEKSAKHLSERVNARPITAQAAIDPAADVCLYAVSDDALPLLAARVNAPHALHVHTSGSTDMNVLAGCANRYGVIYPLQTFTKDKPVRLSDIHFFIEGSDATSEEQIRRLALTLSGNVKHLSSAERLQLHVAAVFACNFTNHLYAVAAELMNDAGLNFDLLQPLIAETTGKIKLMPPTEAQTGPALRNDRHIINKHLTLLKGKRNLETIYRLLSDDIHTIYRK